MVLRSSCFLLGYTLFVAIFCIPLSAKADMGSATVRSNNSFTSKKKYDAWCGTAKKDCKVKFVKGRLSVDNSRGITKDQLVGVYNRTYCAFGGFIGNGDGCTNSYGQEFLDLMDKEFQI